MRLGDKARTNRMFRARIYAQGFTLAAMLGGSVYYKKQRDEEKEVDVAKAKIDAQAKQMAWIRELEIRDKEDKEVRAPRSLVCSGPTLMMLGSVIRGINGMPSVGGLQRRERGIALRRIYVYTLHIVQWKMDNGGGDDFTNPIALSQTQTQPSPPNFHSEPRKITRCLLYQTRVQVITILRELAPCPDGVPD